MFEISTDALSLRTFPIGSLQINCTLIINKENNQAIVIDPGDDDKELLKLLKKNNLIPIYLLHTHGHYDHIGQSHLIKAHFDIPIYLHQKDFSLYHFHLQGKKGFDKKATENIVDSELDDGQLWGLKSHLNLTEEQKAETIIPSINLNLIKIIHTPGHTQGSCCLFIDYFARPILISGDTLFRESIGRTDLPGGNSKQIVDSIVNKLFQLPENTAVIPGHGPLTTIEHEKNHNPFIRNQQYLYL